MKGLNLICDKLSGFRINGIYTQLSCANLLKLGVIPQLSCGITNVRHYCVTASNYTEGDDKF